MLHMCGSRPVFMSGGGSTAGIVDLASIFSRIKKSSAVSPGPATPAAAGKARLDPLANGFDMGGIDMGVAASHSQQPGGGGAAGSHSPLRSEQVCGEASMDLRTDSDPCTGSGTLFSGLFNLSTEVGGSSAEHIHVNPADVGAQEATAAAGAGTSDGHVEMEQASYSAPKPLMLCSEACAVTAPEVELEGNFMMLSIEALVHMWTVASQVCELPSVTELCKRRGKLWRPPAADGTGAVGTVLCMFRCALLTSMSNCDAERQCFSCPITHAQMGFEVCLVCICHMHVSRLYVECSFAQRHARPPCKCNGPCSVLSEQCCECNE